MNCTVYLPIGWLGSIEWGQAFYESFQDIEGNAEKRDWLQLFGFVVGLLGLDRAMVVGLCQIMDIVNLLR